MTGEARRTDKDGISVVVPTLNDRDGLDELLHALGAQTRAPDEVVVVGGGSTDGTSKLLEAWRAGSRVPVQRYVPPAYDSGIRVANDVFVAQVGRR